MSQRLRIHPSAADVDIGVIYTYEDHFMNPLLESLAQSGEQIRMRLLLVDNASQHGTRQWESIFEETCVIHNDRRQGYAANLNRVLEHSTAEYILLLNTDMYFDPAEQCVARMVRFMNAHPDCGIAGCRLYHEDQAFAYPARRFQSIRTIAARRLGLASLLNAELDDYLYRHHLPEDTFECEWLSGCFLMVRRAAFEDIGYLDANFGKYFEDVDFCLRAAQRGWRIMFCGDTYAYHLEQRASRKLLSVDAFRHLVAYVRWLRKWGLDPREHIPPRPEVPVRRAA